MENYENQLKVVNNNNIKKHRPRWLSPNNRISSDVILCPKYIGIASLRKEDIAIASQQKFDHRPCSNSNKMFFLHNLHIVKQIVFVGRGAPYLYHHSGNFANLANFGQLWPDNGI